MISIISWLISSRFINEISLFSFDFLMGLEFHLWILEVWSFVHCHFVDDWLKSFLVDRCSSSWPEILLRDGFILWKTFGTLFHPIINVIYFFLCEVIPLWLIQRNPFDFAIFYLILNPIFNSCEFSTVLQSFEAVHVVKVVP